MAGNKDLANATKQKELVQKYLTDSAPRIIKKALKFIDDHLDSEDALLRRDAQKLFIKYFDKMIPTTQKVEFEDTTKTILDDRILKALDLVTHTEQLKIANEVTTITEVEAIEIRNTTSNE